MKFLERIGAIAAGQPQLMIAGDEEDLREFLPQAAESLLQLA